MLVSENSKQAFKRKLSEGSIPSVPKIKIGERALAPHSRGELGYGRVVKFIGDQAEIYFRESKDKELVFVDSIRPPLQAEDKILVQIQLDDSELEFLSQDNDNISFPGERFIQDMEVSLLQNQGHERVFLAIVNGVNDDGTLQIRTVKNGSVLYRKIHPKNIINIQNQSTIF